MAYTPPAYNVVNADLKPVGSAAVVIPAYNVVNANLAVEDGGGGGSSQTIVPSGINSGEIGSPVFMLYHSFITELGGIETSEWVGYPTFELGDFYIEPYGIPSAEWVGTPSILLKKQYINPLGIDDSQVGYPELRLGKQYLHLAGIDDSEVGLPEFFQLTQVIRFSGVETSELLGEPSFILQNQVIAFQGFDYSEVGEPEFHLVDIFLDVEFGSGEDLSFDVSLDQAVESSFEDGQEFEAELHTDEAVVVDGFDGQEIDVSLETYELIALEIGSDNGEAFELELSTDESIAAEYGEGQELSLELQDFPIHYLDLEFGTGETLWVDLDVLSPFTNLYLDSMDVGQVFEFEIDVPPGNNLEIVFGSGVEFSLVDFSTAASLGEIEFNEGVSIGVESVDELSNYKAADGATLSTSLSVSVIVDGGSSTGESLDVVIDTRPPEFLDVEVWVGEELVPPSIRALVSAPLRVTFGEGVYITATESTSTTSFDLEGDPPSYPNRLQWWLDMNQFEFIDMLPSFVWGHGTGIVVQADLQARPRFSISCATGESFAMVRGYDYMEIEAFSGLQAPTQEFIHLEPHVNLCYPNVIPNADAMEVELDFNEETCYADFLYEGQYLRSALSCVYTVAPVQWVEGSRLDFDLTISDLWRLRFWTGQRLEFYLGTVPVLPINFSTGEAFRGTFEEPSVLMHAGESVELELTITFEVEFLERGCLDNEYKYMTPNGDEDKEKFNPVAVELEPFAHEIKARCF